MIYLIFWWWLSWTNGQDGLLLKLIYIKIIYNVVYI